MRSTIRNSGVILFNKPAGVTSFSSLFPLKLEYGSSLGHTGTLDSFAEGLLVVLVGRLTKLSPILTHLDKVYEAEFTFGIETDTLDPQGAPVFSGELPSFGIVELAQSWIGQQRQVPPQYSAIHLQGSRASDRVRRGEVVEIPPRLIEIYNLEVLDWTSPRLTVRIHCSKGTYVRSLARDWGRKVGCGAHVSRLKRLKVGPFDLPTKSEPQFLEPHEVFDRLKIPRIVVPASHLAWIENGRSLVEGVPELLTVSSSYAVLESEEQRLLALVERQDSEWIYRFVNRDFPS